MKKLSSVIIIFINFVFLLECASMNKNETVFFDEVGETAIKLELIVKKFSLKSREFIISLKITNLIDNDIALENWVLHSFDLGETNWDIIVTNEKGEEIDYLGILVSRLPTEPTLNNCTILKARETLVIECPNLYDNYDFDGEYSDIKYKELNFYYITYLGQSNTVTITDFD